MQKAMLILKVDREEVDRIVLKKEVTTFGRFDADVLLVDPEVSNSHFKIELVGKSYFVQDLNSTNGTKLNGLQVHRSRLRSGDKITIGGLAFVFVREKDHEAVLFGEILQALQEQAAGLTHGSSKNVAECLRELGSLKKAIEAKVLLRITAKWCTGNEEVLEIDQRQLEIGRVCEVGNFADDIELSRKHCSVWIDSSGLVWIDDLGSTNGTYVNQEKIAGAKQVWPNDRISIGNTIFYLDTWLP